jgi:spore coat polysaccharide biosynthesis predicted glycosyltransferase SpsG
MCRYAYSKKLASRPRAYSSVPQPLRPLRPSWCPARPSGVEVPNLKEIITHHNEFRALDAVDWSSIVGIFSSLPELVPDDRGITGAEIVLAFDIGPSIGLGHKRRMAAIAVALSESGTRPVLVNAADGASADVVVVDSYAHRADDRDRFSAGVTVAIDDLQRDLAVDLLVDPTPGATGEPHRSARTVLAGSRYALVDPNVRLLTPAPVGSRVRSVLASCGGGENGKRVRELARVLRNELSASVAVQCVLGPWATEFEPIDGIDEVRAYQSLTPNLAASDVVITAGGVTLLEALALGRPSIAIAISEHQQPTVNGVARAGAALAASDEEDAAALTSVLVHNESWRRELSRAATSLVDGRGAYRVVESITQHLAGR